LSEEKKKKDLWFQFDNYFHFEIQRGDPKVDAMNEVMGYSNTKPFGTLTSKDLTDYLNTETARPLINSVRNNLLPGYVEIFNNFFGQNFDQETTLIDSFPWDAFVNFGLGMLYDPRPPRPKQYYIHVMDMGNTGYSIWHRFNWIASLLNKAEVPFSIGKWLYLDRLVGLAAELHSRSKPNQSSEIDGSPPDNPPNGDNISMNEIHRIAYKWSNLDFEGIEKNLSELEDWIPRHRGLFMR
jgi:hypothetical protein